MVWSLAAPAVAAAGRGGGGGGGRERGRRLKGKNNNERMAPHRAKRQSETLTGFLYKIKRGRNRCGRTTHSVLTAKLAGTTVACDLP